MANPELRDALDRELQRRGHGATTVTEWRWLRGEGTEWLAGLTVSDLVDKITGRRARHKSNRLPAEPGTIPTNLAKLATALSLHLADLAEQRDDVHRFRAAHLDGHTIPVDDVGAWIERAARGVRPSMYVTAAAPDGWQPGDPIPTDAYGAEVRVVDYPIGRYRGSVPVRAGHVLDHLRVLADELAAAYAWQPGQASAFVLSGAVPVVQMIHNTAHPARALITLSVHPLLAPDQLTPMYAHRRDRIGRRVRITDSTLDLVTFVLEQGNTPSAYAAWRRAHPDDHRAPKVLRQTVKTARATLDRWVSPPTPTATNQGGVPQRPLQPSAGAPDRRHTPR
jgi:hypothetical protein